MRPCAARRRQARPRGRAAGRRRAVLRPLRLLGGEDRRCSGCRDRYERDRLLALELVPGALADARGLVSATGRRRAGAALSTRWSPASARPIPLRRARREPPCPGVTRYERIDPHDREPRAARRIRRPDRHDRLRLHRPRRAAAAGATPRLRSIEVRRHRPGRHRSGPARRARPALRAGCDHQGELPAGPHAAAHRRARPRHDHQPVGRHLLGRR